jgi:hypothetical protein
MIKLKLIGVVLALVVMAVGVWSGCESAEGIEGLTVSPASVIVSNSSSSVSFTAFVDGNMALPLEWSVSAPNLGTIVSHSGSNAVYKANKGVKGDNIITARDQYGNEGAAVVTQL